MEETQENRKIEINELILKNLKTAGRWSMFLAIIGFISFGIIAVFGILTGTFLSVFSSVENGLRTNEALIVVAIFVVILIGMFPIISLFRFSKRVAKAVHSADTCELEKAFKNLKYFFRNIGILTIVLLAVYIASLVLAGASINLLN